MQHVHKFNSDVCIWSLRINICSFWVICIYKVAFRFGVICFNWDSFLCRLYIKTFWVSLQVYSISSYNRRTFTFLTSFLITFVLLGPIVLIILKFCNLHNICTYATRNIKAVGFIRTLNILYKVGRELFFPEISFKTFNLDEY